MKILFITSSSINGGAQKHICDMFRCLSQQRNEVFLAAPSGWLMNELPEYSDKLTVLQSINDVDTIVRIMSSIRPDITNTFILSGGIAGTKAWLKEKYGKLFVTVNNPVIYEGISLLGRILYPLFYRWMSKSVSAFLVKSDSVRDEVAKVIHNKKPVLSIKNGIDFNIFDSDANYPDLRSELGIAPSDLVVSNVAALEERKGQRYLIDAIKAIHDSGKAIHLMLVGEGTDEMRLREYVGAASATEYIHFLGRRSDVNSVLANSDIFALASLHEGLPNALMEAMAMRLPCVATDVGGVRQLISDQSEGSVIESKSTEEIRSTLERILSLPDFGISMGEKAHKRMYAEYSLDAAANQLLQIYEG